MKAVDFRRWGSGRAVQGPVVPYLDIDGTDEPIDFLFSLNDEQGFIARGNMQVVKGREKTGKSAMGIALIVAALKGEFLHIKPNRDDYTLLWIDTEQDKTTLRKRAKAAIKMSSKPFSLSDLHIVPLKGESPSEGLKIALKAIWETQPDFVFIDGAVDLCDDFNDNKESVKVMRELMKATEENNCAILCVIHTNKKDDEARGHLGTILQQKCSEVYEVTKTGDNATIRQDKCRFADIPEFSFRFADGFMLEEPEGAASKADSRKAELLGAFQKLYATETKYTHTELKKSYAEREAVSERTARERIKEAVDFGILENTGTPKKSCYEFLFPDIKGDEDDDL